MPQIDVCFSPNLLNLHTLSDKIVVIVDILRATSCMVAGLGSGVKSILPVATLEESQALAQQGYICAGERNGHKVEGFSLGNSPFEYMTEAVKGQKIAMTTTNGTQALVMAKEAKQIVIGAFLNLSAIAQYLHLQATNVLIVCAGWKGKFCVEDALFSGALVSKLVDTFEIADDSALAALTLYTTTSGNISDYLKQSAHYKRLSHLEGGQDVKFCTQIDTFHVVPKLIQGEIVS